MGWEPKEGDVEATLAPGSDDLARLDSLPGAGTAPTLPGYQLRERLGRGAFGEVWSALQERTGQEVAVKIFLRAGDLGPLRREVERLGQVARHPHVVNLLDADLDHDPPYVVMPLLSSSLQDLAAGSSDSALVQVVPASYRHSLMAKPWFAPAWLHRLLPVKWIRVRSVERIQAWFEQMVSALQYIHGKGILHCDLKPANVLVDEEGTARITDFGQAHLLNQEGASLGTLWYMAPEQAAAALGETTPPDVSWDVYALGATVYHLLTGQPPRATPEARGAVSAQPGSKERLEAYQEIVARQPLVPVRALNERVDRDLAEIVEHCLVLDPRNRYVAVGEVAEDLGRRSRLQPLKARRPSPVYLAGRFLRRNRWAAAALLVLALSMGSAYLRTAGALTEAIFARGLADAQREGTAVSPAGLLSIMEAVSRDPGSTLYRATASSLLVSRPGYLWSWTVNPGRPKWGHIYTLKATPDRARFVQVLGRYPQDILVYNAGAVKFVGGLRHPDRLDRAVLDEDGSRAVGVTTEGQLFAWEVDTATILDSWKVARVNPVDLSRDGRRVASCATARDVLVLDLETRKSRILEHPSEVCALALGPKGSRLLTACLDGTTRVWDLDTGRILAQPRLHRAAIRWEALAFRPDGRAVATADEAGQVCLWNPDTGQRIGPATAHSSAVAEVRFGPGGRRLATAAEDGTVGLLDGATGRPVCRPLDHPQPVRVLDFSPDGRLLLTADVDERVRFWHADTGAPALDPVRIGCRAFFDGHGRVIAGSCRGHQTTGAWDVTTPLLHGAPMPHEDKVLHAEFSPDGKRVVTASSDGTVRTWEAATGTPVTAPLLHGDVVNKGRFDPTGKRVVTSSWAGGARTWDAATGEKLLQVPDEAGTLEACFDPAGRRILSASADGFVRLLDAETGRPLAEPMRHGDLEGASFSGDGERILTFGGAHVRLWDSSTGRLSAPLMGLPQAVVTAAAFSPDGETVASLWRSTSRERNPRPLFGYYDRGWRLVLWDARTGEARQVLQDDPVTGFQFSPTGTLATLHHGHVRLWDSRSGREASEPLWTWATNLVVAAFDPEAARLAVGSSEGTVEVYDLAKGSLALPPFRHGGEISSVEFAPEGRGLLTASEDGTARAWLALADEDIPPDLLDLEIRCWTGFEVLSEPPRVVRTGRGPRLSPARREVDPVFVALDDKDAPWKTWKPVAARHARECRFPEANLYLRLQKSGKLDEVGHCTLKE